MNDQPEHSESAPRWDEAVHDELLTDGGIVLYHPGQNRLLMLNPTGALVWAYCDGAHTLAEIAGTVATVFPGPTSVEWDVADLVGTLRAYSMLVQHGESSIEEHAPYRVTSLSPIRSV